MTVAELIEELKRLPQHHPVLCDVGQRYDESIRVVETRNLPAGVGPVVIIRTSEDSRNYTE